MQNVPTTRSGRRAPWWWIIAVIWVANVASALAVVAVTQNVRRDIGQLESLKREAAELEVQWGQYLLERSTWASYARIEKKAREQLDMTMPQADDIILMNEEP